jgi:hypothetical protein
MRGHHGWVALAAFVAAWDLTQEETLSAAFRRTPTPIKTLAWGVTTAHLFGVLPRQIDPFYLLVDRR